MLPVLVLNIYCSKHPDKKQLDSRISPSEWEQRKFTSPLIADQREVVLLGSFPACSPQPSLPTYSSLFPHSYSNSS